jgi:DNA mismatch repair ATPase MutS
MFSWMYVCSFVLSDVQSRSLVLVDELGKGTEVHAGTALAGAMLEQLAASGCAGVFATHLHMLLPGRLELNAPGLTFAKMDVREESFLGGWASSTLSIRLCSKIMAWTIEYESIHS